MFEFFAAVINGLTAGSIIFMVAAGLTIVFGVAGILNFAHGGIFMAAAFTMAWTVAELDRTLTAYLVGAVAAIAVAAVLGFLLEVGPVRRFYGLQHEFMLIGTFALLLLLEGGTELTFGVAARSTPMPEVLRGAIEVAGLRVPRYSVAVVALGLVCAAGAIGWLRWTRTGKVARTAAYDAECSQALGINVPRVLLLVFVLGSALAGLAAAALAPNQSVDLMLATSYIVLAFAVVVVGGLGSVSGALVAALVLGLADSLWFTYLPQVPQVAPYVAMVLILIVRPQGLARTQEA